MYLVILIHKQGGYDGDVKAVIDNGRVAFLQHQIRNPHYGRQDSSAVWSCNFENYYNHYHEDTSICKEFTIKDAQCPLARQHQKRPTVRKGKPDSG